MESLPSDALSKYHSAAAVVNQALAELAEMCKADAVINQLCIHGDQRIEELLKGHFASKKGGGIKKGVAFPTCISANEICGHDSPLSDDTRTIKDGDLVKIDLACHIDGFIATGAHSLVVGATAAAPVEGKKAQVMMAAQMAAEVASKAISPEKTNNDITRLMKKVVESYDCKMLSGVLSHQLLQNVIDGNKVILGRESTEEKVDEANFVANELYSLDVLVSTGEGKPKELGWRPNIFKRDIVQNYKLKTPMARSFFHDVTSNYPTMPFHLRNFDERSAKVGVSECMRHALVQSYPVFSERPGEFVAQVKFTVFVSSTGAKRLTTKMQFPIDALKVEQKIEDDEVLAILAQPEPAAKKA